MMAAHLASSRAVARMSSTTSDFVDGVRRVGGGRASFDCGRSKPSVGAGKFSAFGSVAMNAKRLPNSGPAEAKFRWQSGGRVSERGTCSHHTVP